MALSIKQEGGVEQHIRAMGFDYDEFNRDMQLELPINRIATILTKLAGKKVTRFAVGKWAKVWKLEQASKRNHVD